MTLLRFSAVTFSLFWVFLLGLVLVNSLPYNPLSLHNYTYEINLKLLLPEGWGFFTKSPKDHSIYILHKKGNRWQYNDLLPIANPANVFGWDRTPRALSTEMAYLVNKVEPELWQFCDEGIFACIQQEQTYVLVKKQAHLVRPILQDTMCFVTRIPVPWAWHDLIQKDKLPCRFVPVIVQ